MCRSPVGQYSQEERWFDGLFFVFHERKKHAQEGLGFEHRLHSNKIEQFGWQFFTPGYLYTYKDYSFPMATTISKETGGGCFAWTPSRNASCQCAQGVLC